MLKYPQLQERPHPITPANAAADFIHHFKNENPECMILTLRSLPRPDPGMEKYRKEFFRLINEKLKN